MLQQQSSKMNFYLLKGDGNHDDYYVLYERS